MAEPSSLPRHDTGADRHSGARPLTRRPHLLAASAALLIALITVLRIGGHQPSYVEGYVLLLAAALFAYAMPGAPGIAAPAQLPRVRDGDPQAGTRLTAGIVLVAAGCTVALRAGYAGYVSFDNLFYAGLIGYLGAALLLALGLFLISPSPWPITPAPLTAALRRNAPEIALVSGVLALALALRLYQLGTYPPADGFSWIDEPQMGLRASEFLHNGVHQWQYPELVYSVALSFKLFGASMLAMRYPVVIAGFLVVCVFYLLARQLFPWPVALVGTLLLAVSRWEIVYFRMVFPACTIMLFELIALLCALYAARGRASYACYAVMGFCVGLGQYSHPSAHLVLLILGVWWVGWLIKKRRGLGPLIRAHAPGWLLFLTVAIVVSLPYLGEVKQDPHSALTERFTSIMPLIFNRSSLPDPVALLKANATTLFGYFTGPGDPFSAVNPLNTPMLDAVTVSLFLLGLGYVLLRRRPQFGLLLVSWCLLTLLLGGLVTADFRGERIIGALPAVYLLACVPIHLAWSWVVSHRGVWSVRSFAAGSLACCAVAGGINGHALYAIQSRDPIVRDTFQYQPIQLLDFIRQHGEHNYGYYLADMAFPGRGSDYGWSVGDPVGRTADDLEDMLPVHDPVGSFPAVTMATAPPYPVDLVGDAIAQLYPGARIYRWTNPDDGRSYLGAVLPIRDLQGSAGRAVGCTPASSCWHGSLYVPLAGRYALSAAESGETLMLEGRAVRGPQQLLPGWYNLTLRGYRPGTMPRIDWSGPAGAGRVPVQYLRNASFHGFLLQFRQIGSTGPLPSGRAPFPFFLFPMGHNQGRPAALVNGFSYQALFTAQIGPGHAGSYSTELWSQGGAATLYLDGRPLARTPPTVPGATAPIVLRLSGHRQLLQLAFEANGQQGGIMGAALFRLDLHGRQAFLPWPWFSPPSPWSGLARWPAS